ncbi:MAG: zinc-binding dehydrogenase [Deltaproteobacteria bacterium]|nr:zinc-binding dehydrogenase [Deltaproteobacteria bacterium]
MSTSTAFALLLVIYFGSYVCFWSLTKLANAAGAMRVVVDRSFPLDEAPEAHRYMETKRARGKVVLEVG